MPDRPLRVKNYPGLRLLALIFKIAALVGLIITLVTIGAALISLLNNAEAGIGAAAADTTQGTIGAIVITFDSRTSTWLGTLGQAVPYILWALVAYAASQLIDVALSINDNLRRLSQPGVEIAKEIQQTADQMISQTKRITALLEQHHRRLDRLETGAHTQDP